MTEAMLDTPRMDLFDDSRLSGDVAAFVDSSDRLVRRLFDIGLRMDSLRAVFDRPESTPEQVREAGAEIGELVEDLDTLIRAAGLAMLGVARNTVPPSVYRQSPRPGARRR